MPRTPAVLARRASLSLIALAAPLVAQQPVPRFERADCPFTPGQWVSAVRLECGQLVVHQVRERPDAGTLRLAVAILHALTPSNAPPLVLLHGGPSGPGGLRSGMLSMATRLAPALQRDVVVYDLRGAGASEPRPLCPEQPANRLLARNETNREVRQQYWNEGARACAAALKARGLDASTFSTPTNAADLIDLRKSLGYRQWDVLGVSYGTRVAQEVMRRDPDGVRSAILDSPVQPGPGQEAEQPLAFQRVLDHTFVACAAQPTCAVAFPTLARDFHEVHDELTARPLDVVFENPTPITARVDGERMLRALHSRFNPRFAPLFIHELRRGDRARAARLLLGTPSGGGGDNSLTNLVGCYESGGAAVYGHVLASVEKQLRPPFRSLLNTEEECAFLQERYAVPSERAFTRGDIPTLILSKEFDDRTPTDYGRRIAAGLTHAYVFEMRGLTHGQGSPCQQTIVEAFLRDPSRAPDASCIDAMPPLVFETRNMESITLVFAIATKDGASNPFTGRWEAAFPGAPLVYRVELTIAGQVVTGVIHSGPQVLTIFDGRVDAATISFKVKPAGEQQRTISFTGTINGDAIDFTRVVDVPPGASPGGAALFGAQGARTFTARRPDG